MSLPKPPAIVIKSPNMPDKKNNPFDSKAPTRQLSMTPQPTNLSSK